MNEWTKIDGDNTLRLDYPLTKESLVYDVGGYEGKWAEKIHDKFGCEIIIFEPVREFYEKIIKRLQGKLENILILNRGLSDKSGFVKMSVDNDSSSALTGELNTNVYMQDIADYEYQVDLIKINIEGGEYALLNRLIDTGKISNYKYIQVQFHTFVEGAEEKRDAIREKLKLTHKEMWNYKFVWESWERL